jgi:apolipoprotein N-acyltransferase
MPLPRLRAFPLAFALGALAACGFAPLALWPLTLLCLAGLIALVADAGTVRRAAAIGWWFGFGHFCLGLNWIATSFTYQAAMPAWWGWVAVILVSLFFALYPALAAGAARWLAGKRKDRPALILFFAATWIVAEYLRATLFTGFAWNPLAAIWVPLTPLPQIAGLTGTYGLSGLTILVAGLLWLAWRESVARIALAVLALAVATASMLAPGPSMPDPAAPLLHVVQPNIGQDQTWSETAAADNYRRLASLSGKPGPRPRLVLWPEVAVPALLEDDALARLKLAELLGPHDIMLTGAEAFQYGPDGAIVSATNSLFGLDANGRLIGRYDKAHLVPYGEYLPMRPLLSALGLSRLAPGDIDFKAGPGPRDIMVPGVGKVGIQICYEIIFSGHVIDRADRPRFLFNPSNDAWFGRWGPPQHLAQARLRAAEEAMPIVRSTPTGISAVIDARGRLLASLPWRTPGAIEIPLPATAAPTLFARFGNILPMILAMLLGAIGLWRRRRRADPASEEGESAVVMADAG